MKTSHYLKYIIAASTLLLLGASDSTKEPASISLLLSSNLQGRFTSTEKDQDISDSMLTTAQTIIAARETMQPDVYIDLGNSFAPGELSRFSHGLLMSEYFAFLGCDATLLSSFDISLGIDTLTYLQTVSRTSFLSANIRKKNKKPFAEYIIKKIGGHSIAFIGLSSDNIIFSAAEKELYDANLEVMEDAIEYSAERARAEGADHIVLVTGLKLQDTLRMLRDFTDISLAICGGDNTARVPGGTLTRVDLPDGRSIVMMPESTKLELLKLRAGKMLTLESYEEIPVSHHRVSSPLYGQYSRRLALWKRQFMEEEDIVVGKTPPQGGLVIDRTFADFLRNRFNAEAAVLEPGTINPAGFKGSVKGYELLALTSSDQFLFTFDLTGAQLLQLASNSRGLVISGIKDKKIQGYPVLPFRTYRVVSTQPAINTVSSIVGKQLKTTNSWQKMTEVMRDDLVNSGTLFYDNAEISDRRFRTTIDIFLSNFIDRSKVRNENDETPPAGMPEDSYTRWGLENRINIAIYNSYHQFIINPYLFYDKQGEDYLKNRAGGAFIYNYNFSENIKPYQKSQMDTQVASVDGLRPFILRETVGAILDAPWEINSKKVISTKWGVGLEKQLSGPEEQMLYGLETIINIKLPFLTYFTMFSNTNSFLAYQRSGESSKNIRIETENGISAAINTHLSAAVKHRYYYRFRGSDKHLYTDSQLITSIDLKADFKIW